MGDKIPVGFWPIPFPGVLDFDCLVGSLSWDSLSQLLPLDLGV